MTKGAPMGSQETRRQSGLDLRAVLASADLAQLLKNTSTLPLSLHRRPLCPHEGTNTCVPALMVVRYACCAPPMVYSSRILSEFHLNSILILLEFYHNFPLIH